MKLRPLIIGIVAIAVLAGVGVLLTLRPAAPETQGMPPVASYNAPHIFTIGQPYVFPDNFSATLISIDDSRCKPGVQCFWQGELAPTLQMKDVLLDGTIREKDVRFGTVSGQTAYWNSYKITLISATETTATFVISVEIADQGGDI